MDIDSTVRPARRMFLCIAEAYRMQALALPGSVEDGHALFERIVAQARWELVTGLWSKE
jgi:hypothetical protein